MGAEAPIRSTVLQPVTKPLSVCLAAEESRDLKLILFLGLASLGTQTTLIVKLAASGRVELALSLTVPPCKRPVGPWCSSYWSGDAARLLSACTSGGKSATCGMRGGCGGCCWCCGDTCGWCT